jgi:soluble lytic murein transglycosylase-like protein
MTALNPNGRHQMRAVFIAALLLSYVTFANAEIYKYVDENGLIHYTSDRPGDRYQVKVLDFPCYAADPTCRNVSWEEIPLNLLDYRDEILAASNLHAVDESLIRAVIHAESAYRKDAVSPKGAQGLMQLMPATQVELAVTDPFDPADNIEGGAVYLAMLLDEFNEDIELAAAAYNAGPGAVRKHDGVPPYAETREYVRRIRILYRRYSQSGG